ncbi:hypothetical protein [Bacteroides acidifaciens]|uniref:hypothetical protein n=1 Tax=Bacteroides acidifaciens TaxID=85831 RepID=UPI003F68BE0D
MESLIWLAFQEMTSGGYELPQSPFQGQQSKGHYPYKAKRESREIPVSCSRALWISSRSSLSDSGKSPGMPCTDWQDYVILNSTANTDKGLISVWLVYGHIHCMLDNDEAGRKAV